MKKLMTMIAVAFIAAASHAAAVGWICAGATAYAGGDYGVYIIGMNDVESVAQIAELAQTGADLSGYQFASGTVTASGAASVLGNASGKSITYSGSGTDTYQAFIVMFTEDGASGSYTSVASISMDNDSTTKNFGFASQTSNLAANTFKVTTTEPEQPGTGDVPEPTSGLLLVLGAAGLALRRRRA